MIIFLLSLVNVVSTLYFMIHKSFNLPIICCIFLIVGLIFKTVFYDSYNNPKNLNIIYSSVMLCFIPLIAGIISIPLKLQYIQEIAYILTSLMIVVASTLRGILLLWNIPKKHKRKRKNTYIDKNKKIK